jgi:predicted PhzF superfamily epimerase YddE/YHI9
MPQHIWVVDAFTSEPLKGNPAGVCFYDEFPDDAAMQEIATKLSFSNSAFVKRTGPRQFDIKWFTPHSEASICGHATIATTHILFEEKMIDEGADIEFTSKVGKLYTNKFKNWYSLNFPAYRDIEDRIFSKEIHAVLDGRPLFNGFCNDRLFMEFASEKELYDLKPNLEALKKIKCRALIATAKGEDEYDFLSRYFAPSVGIDEDPVCASAHCILIPYWSEKLKKKNMMAYQASKRGGVIKCQDMGNRVMISGEAITIAKGELDAADLTKYKFIA